MIDERQEFQCYTVFPTYRAAFKKDVSFLNRITFPMILKTKGFTRVLTILARGYLYDEETGAPDIERAQRALCAWCSIRGEKTADWQFDTCFPELHTEFPELVDEKGNGWLYRHVHRMIDYVVAHPDEVLSSLHKNALKAAESFDRNWQKKVIQFQIGLFSESTKNDWLTLFDDILANALVLGPLRSFRAEVAESAQEELLQALLPKMPLSEAVELIAYYKINRLENADWALFPNTNFEAFFGNTNFTHKYETAFFKTFGEKTKEKYGVVRYRIHKRYADMVNVIEI